MSRAALYRLPTTRACLPGTPGPGPTFAAASRQRHTPESARRARGGGMPARNRAACGPRPVPASGRRAVGASRTRPGASTGRGPGPTDPRESHAPQSPPPPPPCPPTLLPPPRRPPAPPARQLAVTPGPGPGTQSQAACGRARPSDADGSRAGALAYDPRASMPRFAAPRCAGPQPEPAAGMRRARTRPQRPVPHGAAGPGRKDRLGPKGEVGGTGKTPVGQGTGG